MILKNKPLLFFMILVLLKPNYFDYVPAANVFYNVGRIVAGVLILILYLLNGRMSAFVGVIIIFEGTLFYSTLINQGDYKKLFLSASPIILICMLAELELKTNAENFVEILFVVLFLLNIVHLLTILLHPDGLRVDFYYGTKEYFLGGRNAFSPVMLLTMLVCILRTRYRGKLLSIVLMVIVSAIVLLLWSATGVVGWFAFLAYYLLIYQKPWERLFSFKNVAIVSVTLFWGIIIFRLQDYMSYIIEQLLHKSTTFTGRTEIWDAALQMIWMKPLLGFGVYHNQGLISWHGLYMYAHNGVLELILQGGFISLSFYLLAVLIAGKGITKAGGESITYLISAAIFCISLIMLTEAFISSTYFMIILIFAANVGYLNCAKSVPRSEKLTKISDSRYIKQRTWKMEEI